MRELHDKRIKRTRMIWIICLLVGILMICVASGLFLTRYQKKKLYTRYIKEGNTYFLEEEYERAAESYQLAIKTDKKQVRGYEGVSNSYIKMEQYSMARYVLQLGIQETGDLQLQKTYSQIENMPDGVSMDSMEAKKNDDEIVGRWDNALIAKIGGYTYKQYSSEYGTGNANIQTGICVVPLESLGAKAYFEIKKGESVINEDTGTPFDGRVPSYLVFDDLTVVFPDWGDGFDMEDIQQITDSLPEITSSGDGGWKIKFEYLNCEFQISCDENGYISDSNAENKVIPLADSMEKDMGIIGGVVVDATTASRLEDVNLNISGKSGGTIHSDISDANGEFKISLPAGDYILEYSKDGYITVSEEVIVTSNCNLDVGTKSLSPSLEAGEWRIVLEWSSEPADLDLHVVSSDYSVNYVSPVATGKDDEKASLDVDKRDGYGPETITITNMHLGNTYEVCVRDFTNSRVENNNALANSGAIVTVYSPTGDPETFNVPSGEGTVWEVLTIVNGQIQVNNTIVSDRNDIP